MPAKAETDITIRDAPSPTTSRSQAPAPSSAPTTSGGPLSKAEAGLTIKGFGSNLVPTEVSTPSAVVQLKKRSGDVLYTLQFNEASLQAPRDLKGVVLSAERKLEGGVKATVAYSPAKEDVLATVTVDKKVNDNDLTLKATYQKQGDVFQLEETWKFDKNNKLIGKYNFKTEEVAFAVEHTRGSLKLGASYARNANKAVVSAEKKRGKDTWVASYCPMDEATLLSWQHKPCKLVLKGKAGQSGVKGVTATVLVTKDFEF